MTGVARIHSIQNSSKWPSHTNLTDIDCCLQLISQRKHILECLFAVVKKTFPPSDGVLHDFLLYNIYIYQCDNASQNSESRKSIMSSIGCTIREEENVERQTRPDSWQQFEGDCVTLPQQC